MQQSYQTRIHLTDAQAHWLGRYAALYGSVQRKLYAALAKGSKANEIKPAFCKEHGLSARQFNAMRIELDGKVSGTTELLRTHKKDTQRRIQAAVRAVGTIKKSIAGQIKLSATAKAKGIAFPLEDLAKLKKRLYGKQLRLASLKNKLKKTTQRLKANLPGICFGSRRLFNQQFYLHQTDFGVGDAGHAAWKKSWDASRNHQVFLVGSKDETGGNQSCKASVVHAPPTTGVACPSVMSLRLKVPPALVAQGAPKFLSIEALNFNHGQASVNAALGHGKALTYRFHRDGTGLDGWRVFVATETVDSSASPKALDSSYGMIGVDFNADHLAVSRTDRFGNPVEFWRFTLALRGRTSDQRTTTISEALERVFAIAKEHNLGIALEDLDFTSKKQELSSLGVKRARMLSGLAYASFSQLALAKGSRSGVKVVFVNPAYTSVAGSVKYASRLGVTTHQAAAGVIARRAQGYSESLPRADAMGGLSFKAPLVGAMAVFSLPARNREESTHSAWTNIRRCLTRHCAERVRSGNKSRPSSKDRRITAALAVSQHTLGGAFSIPSEPEELLVRRCDHLFEDVPL